MENLKIGEIVGINVHALYSAFGLRLSKTEIEVVPKNRVKGGLPSDYFYDLNFQSSRDLACMDGEECAVASVDEYGNITFQNDNGDEPVFFTLSPAEVSVAIFQ